MARSRAPLIVFGDSRTFLSTTLVAAVLDAARARGLQAVVCEAARHPPPPRVRAGGSYVLASAGRRLFDPAHPIVLGRPMWTGLEGLARRARVPLTVPPGRDVNDPSFVAGLRDRFTPALALAVGCAQVFRRPLLDAFEPAVNYHNGLLPAYRGWRATSWSVYNREPETGFAFHVMTEGIDEGPILAQGAIPVRSDASVLELEWEKTQRAAACVDGVLERMVAGASGREQEGPASYFGKCDLHAIRSVGDPSDYTWDELLRRVRAFGIVSVKLDGIAYDVTRFHRLAGGEHGPRGLVFTTSDGVAATPDRIRHLPVPLARVFKGLAGSGAT